jgi:voltage-gated potassium channel
MDKKTSIIELIIIILVLTDTILLLAIIFYDFSPDIIQTIVLFDLMVCIILAIDYINRIKKETDKKSFIISNWIDIIAMLPDILLNIIFSLFGLSGVTGFIRLLRLVRVARVLILFKKNITLFTNFIKETHLDKLLTIVAISIIGGSITFWLIEGVSFINSVWYVLSTITTLGYGDIVPTTSTGKVIGLLLIIVGILLFSILTASISSIYTKRIEDESKKELDERLKRIEEKLDKLSDGD